VTGSKSKLSDFTFLKVLGRGSFGKVLLAEHARSGNIFAVKSLKKETILLDNDSASVMAERNVFALTTGCPFLTQVHSTFQTRDRMFFVMEFVQGGDLFFQITSTPGSRCL
jgi:novel protein kinase C epsilon type